MDYKNIIWIFLNVLMLFIFGFIGYKLYIRQKYYSGKKYVWSKHDQDNIKLIGYHAYEKALIPICIAIMGFSEFIQEYSDFLSAVFKIIFCLLIIYVIISFIVISKKKNYKTDKTKS